MTGTDQPSSRARTTQVLYKPIDISNFAIRKAEIGQQLLEAATATGFWTVTGHDIPAVGLDCVPAVRRDWTKVASSCNGVLSLLFTLV